jgi:hypothetical protein
MAIDFRPLPPEDALIAAGAAMVALGESRLLVHAHRFGAEGSARDEALAAAYTAFLGFETLRAPWPAVAPADLLPALAALVSRPVAYPHAVVDVTVARDAVARWLAGFPPPFRACTNGDVLLDHARPQPSGGWYNPVIGTTFDTGAIVIASGVVGMLWAAGED